MIWDFVEGNILSGSTRDWLNAVQGSLKTLESLDDNIHAGQAHCAPSDMSPVSDDAANAFITDPPYYDAVPYADLSDFFFVWLKRSLSGLHNELLTPYLTPKEDECIVDEVKGKDKVYFETTMSKAMAEGRRILDPKGIGVIVFAHKSTTGWEAMLQSMIDAGWIFVGSWPIDTEMSNRLRAMDSAALASSIHLVCRPRENPDGSVREDRIGDWRSVLQELPERIHSWLPRLAEEGVVGADAIFSCLGPALEIYRGFRKTLQNDQVCT
jgi:adenine-specific DNA methylase